jgi:predicted dehydrogenase
MRLQEASEVLMQVGVIGAGAFAEACHLPGLQKHPHAKVVAICGRNHARTRAMADRFGIPAVYTDYRELCARADIDAVTIVTPNAAHAEQAVVAFQHGKHVFCEKPLGVTVAEADEMLRAAEASQKIHQVGFIYRYLYGVQELKRLIGLGMIGEPHYVRVQFDTWQGLNPESVVGFREKISLAGGGMLYDVGCHLFDLTTFVVGAIQAVTGFTKLIPRERIDISTGKLAAVETDDIAASWFVCENGLRGQWFASRATPCSAEKAYIEVIGQEGALKASLSRGSVDTLQVSRPTKQAWEHVSLPEEASDGRPHCLHIMMRRFVDACLRGKQDGNVDASFYDGLVAQRAIAAVSEASGRLDWIRLEKDQHKSEVCVPTSNG